MTGLWAVKHPHQLEGFLFSVLLIRIDPFAHKLRYDYLYAKCRDWEPTQMLHALVWTLPKMQKEFAQLPLNQLKLPEFLMLNCGALVAIIFWTWQPCVFLIVCSMVILSPNARWIFPARSAKLISKTQYSMLSNSRSRYYYHQPNLRLCIFTFKL